MSFFGLIVFAMAQLGYTGLIRMAGVNKYMSWITAMVAQTLALYFLAMLNLLEFGLKAVVIVGCIGLVVRVGLISFNRGKLPFEGIHYFDFWMLFLGIMMGRTLYLSPLIHYDNYSHWAVMVKFLLFQGHLPAGGETLISFTSYPPAAALWITEFVSWVGFSEGAMLVGQFLLIWAGLYALFAALRDRSRTMTAFFLCFIIAISNVFNIAIRMNNLLVDFVLPVLAAAAFAGIYSYRRHPWLQCVTAGIFSAELLLIKNSGTMYVVMIGCYLMYSLTTNYGVDKRWLRIRFASWRTALTMGLSYLPFFWWNQHVHNTFHAVTKHQISAQAYQSQLNHESSAVMGRISHQFIHQILTLNSLSTRGVLLINIGLIVAWVVIGLVLHKRTPLLKVLLAIDLSFVVYYVSVLAMYLVSMPYKEAIHLDGLERYLSSMVVLNLFLAALAIAIAMDRAMFVQEIQKRGVRSFSSLITKNIYQFTTLALMIFSTILMISEIDGVEYNNAHSQEALPVQLPQIAKQTTKYNHQKVLLVDPHQDDVASYYAGYVGKYYFFSDNVVAREDFMMSPTDFKKLVQSYQYIALPEWHRTFTVMLQKTYHQDYRTGLFRVTPEGLVKVRQVKP